MLTQGVRIVVLTTHRVCGRVMVVGVCRLAASASLRAGCVVAWAGGCEGALWSSVCAGCEGLSLSSLAGGYE